MFKEFSVIKKCLRPWSVPLTLKQVFFSLILNIFQGVSSEKTFYVEIAIVPGDIDAKKTRKTFHRLHINFFLNAEL